MNTTLWLTLVFWSQKWFTSSSTLNWLAGVVTGHHRVGNVLLTKVLRFWGSNDLPGFNRAQENSVAENCDKFWLLYLSLLSWHISSSQLSQFWRLYVRNPNDLEQLDDFQRYIKFCINNLVCSQSGASRIPNNRRSGGPQVWRESLFTVVKCESSGHILESDLEFQTQID